MKALLLAAAIALPPNALGVWTSEDGKQLIELTEVDLSRSIYGGEEIQTVTCAFKQQAPGHFGYAMSCSDELDRVLEFYDTGVMSFDGVRFIYGD